MKQIIILFFLICTAFLGSAQTFQMYQGDTINYKDANGLKQRRWIFFNSTRRLPGYKPDQKVEEGPYTNSRKNGIWKKYFSNGNVKDEVTYKMNRASGPYKVYYENGKIEEEGVWKSSRNVGTFKRYHPNGKMAQNFAFNASGKREGKQQYFHENGQLMIEGDWDSGKESGELVEYYENGDIKAKKVFNEGSLDALNTKLYAAKSPVKDKLKEEEKKAPVANAVVKKTERPNQGRFDGNGHHKLYDLNKQITKSGYFKNYKLMDGKWYKYDKNGILINIEIIKNGRYIGDAQMEEQ